MVPIRTRPPRSRDAGGCDFATDPTLTSIDGPIFWTPDADPATLLLTQSPPEVPSEQSREVRRLASRPPVQKGPDGQDQVILAGGEPFPAIVLSGPEPVAGLAAVVLLDDDTQDRIAALSRFWTALRHPPARPDDRLTPQRRRRLRQMLRVVDARQAGATYRTIAETLFPQHHIEAASWAGNALRETTIRLARDGLKLVDGGYRTLLRRPRRS